MIHKLFITTALILILKINLFGINIDASYKFDDDFLKIIDQKDFEIQLINIDENKLTYQDIFYYFCLFSENYSNYDKYLNWFMKLNETMDNKILKKFNIKNFNNLSLIQNEKIIEFILESFHDLIFKKYNDRSFRLSDLIENQEYNCVSSTIILYIFLKKYGITCYPVETKDHVFLKVLLNNEEFDIETTNKYGFNPGDKKDVLDDFGKITGFAYIPPQNYKDRNIINIKKLISMIYNNFYEKHVFNNDYIKAVNSGFIIMKLRNDNKGNKLFENIYYNFLVNLYNLEKYYKTIELVNCFFIYFYQNQNFINLRNDALYEIIKDFNDYENFELTNTYLITQNNLFNNLTNSKEFKKIYNMFFYKNLIVNIESKNFKKNYLNFNILINLYTDEHTILFFELIIDNELKSYENYNVIFDKIFDLKLLYPNYIELLNKYQFHYQKEDIKNLLAEADFNKALEKAKSLYVNNHSDSSIKNILIDCYLSYSNHLYKNNSFNDLIKIIDESLSYFPDNITMNNNYLNYYKNYIDEYINEKKYNKARQIYNLAIEKFSNNDYLIKINKILQDLKY